MTMNLTLSGMARLRGLILWMFIAIPSIALPSMLAYALGLRVNTTRSLPMGIYAVTNDAFSELIEFCPEGNAAKESKNRGYRNTGSCPDGAEPLIKPVVAREGDVVE